MLIRLRAIQLSYFYLCSLFLFIYFHVIKIFDVYVIFLCFFSLFFIHFSYLHFIFILSVSLWSPFPGSQCLYISNQYISIPPRFALLVSLYSSCYSLAGSHCLSIFTRHFVRVNKIPTFISLLVLSPWLSLLAILFPGSPCLSLYTRNFIPWFSLLVFLHSLFYSLVLIACLSILVILFPGSLSLSLSTRYVIPWFSLPVSLFSSHMQFRDSLRQSACS